MELREDYKKYSFETIRPLKIKNFFLYGRPIGLINKDDKLHHNFNEGLFQYV